MSHVAEVTQRQEFEGSVGRFVGIPARLALLEFGQQAGQPAIVLGIDEAEPIELGEEI